MKKYFSLLLFVNIFFTASSQDRQTKDPFMTKSFAGQSIGSVHSETSGGNISVTAADASESRVEVYVWQNNEKKNLPDDELKTKINEDYDLNISLNNSKLTVTAKQKHKIKDWKKSLNFSFKIYVPKSADLDLETSGGNINLKGLSGNKDFATSGGNLNIESVEGKTKGRTSGGNISLKNSKDDLDLSTSGGNIYAENSTGTIDITTSGGNVQISDLKGNVKAETSGGSIKGDAIEGDLSAHTSGGNISLQRLNCSLKTATSGGNIDVSMNSVGKFVSIRNSAGKVSLQIPKNANVDLKLSAMKISTGNMENFKGSYSKEEINGALNGGGVPVTVDAGSGKIDLGFN